MPFVDPRLIRKIAAERQGQDAVVPRTATGFEPLFALYGKACLPPMRELLEAGRFRILDFYDRVRLRELAIPSLSPWEKSLVNINTPDDLQAAGGDLKKTQ